MGLKKNVSYSVILTLSTYLVPLLVYPYISRVLGPSGIGRIDRVDSVIDYCILFSMLGLTTIGIREIARCRGDRMRLDRTFSSLFAINLISTALVMVVLGALVLTVPAFSDRRSMFLIGMTKIVSNLFWIEWFFKGLEDFRYITIRSVAIRLLFIVLVFVFVRDRDDVMVYYALWVGITFMNAVCNWTHRHRFASLSLRNVDLKPFLGPVVLIGLFSVFSAIYTKLNVFYLGTVSDDTQVGYYTTATRLYSVLIALFASITGVMIPRMSILSENHRMDEFKLLAGKTFLLLFMFAVPVMLYFEFFAPEFIMLFTGRDFSFAGAVAPMRIVMLQLLIIGSEQIIILQLLIPAGYDRQSVMCAVTGALVCALVNALLLPEMGCTGSATAWVLAELSVLLLSLCFAGRLLDIHFPLRLLLKVLLLSIPYAIFGTVSFLIDGPMLKLLVGAVLYGIWFAVLCFAVILPKFYLGRKVLGHTVTARRISEWL